MELKSLYTVKKIVETGNYQRAAMALNYAQSTITFQIRQLENELGIRLFEKNGKQMLLTREGEAIMPYIDRVIEAADELLHYNNGTDRPHGALRIAIPETLATYKIQPILKRLKKEAPDIRLYLQVMNCYAIYDMLVDGKIDIALHYDIKKYPASIEIMEIGTYPLVMVASPELGEADSDLITPDQRKSICHIENDRNALYLKILERYLKEKNITLETGMELGSIEAIKESVKNNLGIAYLPRFTVEKELELGLLKECHMDMQGEMTEICAYHKKKLQNPSVSFFLKLIQEELLNVF